MQGVTLVNNFVFSSSSSSSFDILLLGRVVVLEDTSKMWAHHHHRFLLFSFTILIIPSLFIISSSSSSVDRVGGVINNDGSGGIAAAATNKLVDSICKQTSNYTFCVESIYTDPRAPKAHDYFLLAYISFGLAYLNATDTLSYIKHELEEDDHNGGGGIINNNNNSSSHQVVLQRCREDYEKAVSGLEEAYNDLNSETYFDLKVLANSASQDALHCSTQQQILLHSDYFKEEAIGGKDQRRRRRRRRGHGHGHSSNRMNNNNNSVVVLRKRNADLRGLCEICVVVSNQFSN